MILISQYGGRIEHSLDDALDGPHEWLVASPVRAIGGVLRPDVLVEPLAHCSNLLRHYRMLAGNRPASPPLAAEMNRLHVEVVRLATDTSLNADVAAARDAHGAGRFQFGTCRKVFQTTGRSKVLWADEEAILQPHGISRKELVCARKRSERLLKRREFDGIHPLANDRPLEALLADLGTERVITLGRGQRKLGKSQRRERTPLIRSDYFRLQAAVFLLADTAALDQMEHVYPLSYVLAVAGACD